MYHLRPRAPFAVSLAAILAGAVLIPATARAATAVVGSVVAIGGTASDIALDEARGQLYVANFGASVIDVVSTADNTIHSSINVLPFPSALALSYDGHYLLVAHYCNLATPPVPGPSCRMPVTSTVLTTAKKKFFRSATHPPATPFVKTAGPLLVPPTNFLHSI